MSSWKQFDQPDFKPLCGKVRSCRDPDLDLYAERALRIRIRIYYLSPTQLNGSHSASTSFQSATPSQNGLRDPANPSKGPLAILRLKYVENHPEKRTEDYIKLAPLASSAARMMCARASMIWEPSELHLGSTGGYLLIFADNTGDNSDIPPPDVVAQIQKEITLENDTIVGWYIIRG